MKRAVALLLTIFFIVALSSIMIKILQKNEKIIDNSSYELNLAKLNLLIKDIQNQTIKYIKKTNDIDDNLPITLPLSLKNIDIVFNIELIDKDKLVINDKKIFNKEEIINNIEFIYDFKQLIKNKKITSFYQIDDIIDKYVYITDDKKINNIKDNFIYNKIKNAKYKIFYTISLNNLNRQVTLYLDKNYKILDRYIF